MRKLVIISHTEHQYTADGRVVGFAPTVNEVNYLAAHWDEIVHIACLENGPPKGNSTGYQSDNITFVSIPSFGGTTLKQKLNVFTQACRILRIIHKHLKGATDVQLRLPMGIGVYVLPYFILQRNRPYRFWVKYANNWVAKPASRGYAFQRWLLRNDWAKCPVTINGSWSDQPTHCISFENPCLRDHDREEGRRISGQKQQTDGPFQLIFVGRVEKAKGIDLLISKIPEWPAEKINCMHIVGDGPLLSELILALTNAGIPVQQHGYLTQSATFELLKASDLLLLPSRSEGFPKVVAEALNFGCVPIVTSVGSVSHYIKDGVNGFLVEKVTADEFDGKLREALYSTPAQRQKILRASAEMIDDFTFGAYLQKLKKNVLNDI